MTDLCEASHSVHVCGIRKPGWGYSITLLYMWRWVRCLMFIIHHYKTLITHRFYWETHNFYEHLSCQSCLSWFEFKNSNNNNNSQSAAVVSDWFNPQTGQRIDMMCGELQREAKQRFMYFIIIFLHIDISHISQLHTIQKKRNEQSQITCVWPLLTSHCGL